MKLYMIRHGHSEANKERIHCGWMDCELTEQGKTQARQLEPIFKDIKFDKVYSSDLSRAMHTCRLALPDADVQALPLIREINIGKLAGVPFDKSPQLFGDRVIKDKRYYNFVPYDGEDHTMLCERIRKFMFMLEKEDFENVAAFSHGVFIHSMLDVVAGTWVSKNTAIGDNCSVSVFEYKDNKWRLKIWNYRPDLIK